MSGTYAVDSVWPDGYPDDASMACIGCGATGIVVSVEVMESEDYDVAVWSCDDCDDSGRDHVSPLYFGVGQ